MLFRKMFREMRQNFGQFFSILILAFLALALYTGLEGNVIGGKQAREAFHEETNLADGWLYGEGFTQENLEAVRELDFVKDAQLRMSVTGAAPDYNGAQVDIYLLTDNLINKPYLIEGEAYDSKDTDGIWLANTFAKAWNIQVGDTFAVSYNGITFEKTVKGLVESSEYEFRISDKDTETDFKNIAFVFMPYEGFPVRDYVNHLIENGTITAEAIAENSDMLEDTEAKLEALGLTVNDITQEMLLEAVGNIPEETLFQLMPNTEMLVTTEGDALSHEEEIGKAIDNNYAVMIDAESITGISRLTDEMAQHEAFSFTFAIVFVLISVLIIATTMGRMVEKQRTQIGTMNAMGLKKHKIMFHYLSYSFLLSLIGAVLGILVGTLVLSSMMADMFAEWYIVPGWKAGCDLSYAAITVLVVGACTLASYFTCRKLMKVKPAEALRPAPPKQGKRCIFEKLPFWNKLGFKTQYNLRDISRAKLRALMGIIGTAVGMLMMVYGITCNSLTDQIYEWTFEKIQRFESELVLSGDISLEEADAMKEEMSGELVMMDQIELAKKANAPSDEKSTQTITVLEGKGLYNLTDTKQNIMELEPGKVYISRRIAEEMDISAGDTVYWHIYTENDWHEAKIGGIYQSPDSQGITYLREDYEKTGNEFHPSILATAEHISQYDSKYVTNVLTKEALTESFEAGYEMVGLLVGVMIFFSVIMIVVVLYNSGNLSFHERVKEFATLKVLGLQSRQIRSLLTIQNLWLSVIGILLGAPCGKWTLNVMMNSNGEQFDYSLKISWQCYLMSGILVLAVSMLVSFFFSKRIKRLDMVEVLKGVE